MKYSFENLTLKVARGPFDYFPYTIGIMENGQQRVYGMTGSLFGNITAALNISYKILNSVDGYWGNLLDDGNFTGPLGMLQRNEADIAVGPFSLKVDYLRYFYTGETHIYEDVPILSGLRRPYVADPFSSATSSESETLALLLVTMLILVLLTTFFQKSKVGEGPLKRLSTFFWMYVESLFIESTRLKPLRGAAARILFGVWLLGIVVFSQYLTGQVKASLMVKAPVSRIDTVTELLSREPPIRPVTLKASPFMNMLQFSGLDTYRALHERIVRLAGELPQSEIYTTSTLRDVLDGRTAILMDTTGNRISVARSCNILGGFFHESSDILETADFRWYINQRLDKALVRAMDVRIRWLLEAGVPFMRHHEMFPQPATCFLDFQGAPGDQYEDLRFQDLSLAFMFLPLAAAFSLLVLGAELVVHRCARLRRPRLATTLVETGTREPRTGDWWKGLAFC